MNFGDILDKWESSGKSKIIDKDAAAEKDDARKKIARASYDVKEGDVIEIQMGEHLLRAKVLLVSEHATKTDASAMYQILP